MDIDLLVKLSARAWSIPILAALHRGVPGRQAALLHATGAGRTAFGQSLLHLVELKLLARNTGHGHPLRPEYVLTDEGHVVAPRAAQISDAIPNQNGHALVRRAWTLPVLAVVQQPIGFNDIKSQLVNVTDRALSQSLQQLTANAWVKREMIFAAPRPRPMYQGHDTGQLVGAICAANV